MGTKRVRVPDSVLAQEVAGESVLLNLASEQYFGLDEVGTRMWAILTSSTSIATAHEALLAEYDVTPEVLWQDVNYLVAQLVEQGLLELVDA